MIDTNPADARTHFRAVLEYDGTDLLGFQLQAEGSTVQGELESALTRLTQQPIRVIGAGRTDAGVHALGQVVGFRATWKHTLADLHRGLNALLSPAIAARSLDIAPPDFHPRFSAIDRSYRYQIGLWPGHSPLRARYAWQLGPGLDIDAMQAASRYLIGTHDFRTFGQPMQDEPTVRRVISADWTLEPPYLYFDIRANAFLRHMVRNIVSALVRVGRRQMSVQTFSSLLAEHNPANSAPPAPPNGLFLMTITYPADNELPRRSPREHIS